MLKCRCAECKTEWPFDLHVAAACPNGCAGAPTVFESTAPEPEPEPVLAPAPAPPPRCCGR